MKIVTKPWGYEKWISVTDKYVMKEIFMVAGKRCSLQYHKAKEESNYILEGKCILEIDGEALELIKGDFFHVKPPAVHRVEAIENLTMIEVSTPEVDDVVRIKDDFDRPNGRIESEHV
uniref:Putative mannose-6-phosphate isomerase n=1 Tax=viral metagenome TaxID=1070528 RepID=A0A6M3JAM2_9ZZZZ